MSTKGAHFRARLRVAGAAFALSLAVAASRPAPPERTLEGLARFLGERVGGTVKPPDLSWEASRGVLADAWLGRRVLFLASVPEGAPRDLYRAAVRVSGEGKPAEVVDLHALSRTPSADESSLQLRAGTAAYATISGGRIRGVTALGLGGAHARPTGLVRRVLGALRAALRTGATAGIARTDVVLEPPPRAARFRLAPPTLTVELDDPSRTITVDLASPATPEPASPSVRVVRHEASALEPGEASLELLGAAVGAAPVRGLDRVLLAARDRVAAVAAIPLRLSSRGRPVSPEPPPAKVLPPSELAFTDAGWPPPAVPSLFAEPAPGEGAWEPACAAPRVEGGTDDAATPPCYTTLVRPVAERPDVEVRLVALDLRRLELRLVAGSTEPLPEAGLPGEGRVPERGGLAARAVVAFGGGAPDGVGELGMMVDGVLVRHPTPDAATIMVTNEGRVAVGAWPSSGAAPEALRGFRQGGALELAAAAVPDGAPRSDPDLAAERSAVCVSRGGHLYHAFGPRVTRGALERALARAGCEAAVELGGHPRSVGLTVLPGGGASPPRLGDPRMRIDPLRYLSGAEEDVLYLLPVGAPEPLGGVPFSTSPGDQPPPTWLPAVHEGTRDLGELELRVYAFDAGRFDWVLRAGSDEPAIAGARSKRVALAPDDQARSVAMIGLGHTTDALRYGLVFDGQPSLELRRAYATLVLARGKAPRVLAPGERAAPGPTEDAVQLPLLADEGRVDTRAGDRGGVRRRGALCVTPGGRVLVAVATHDSSDPLAASLLDLGCRRVVALDRGSRQAASVTRAGPGAAPPPRTDETVLHAVGRAMVPRGEVYRAEAGGAPPDVTPPRPAAP